MVLLLLLYRDLFFVFLLLVCFVITFVLSPNLRVLAMVALLLFVVACAGFVQLPNVGLKYAREQNPSLQTPLDKYVWNYDTNAGFDVYPKTYAGKGFTAYVLDFKSQEYFPNISSRPIWQHWLTVCIPEGNVQVNFVLFFFEMVFINLFFSRPVSCTWMVRTTPPSPKKRCTLPFT
jgi:Ca2+/Na+ antiporter